MTEKKKKPIAHERAIELLKKDPIRFFDTLVELYKDGTVVPEENATDLVSAFLDAQIAIKKADTESIQAVLISLKGQSPKKRLSL